MTFPSFASLFRSTRDIANSGVSVYSSSSDEYTALVITTTMHINDRDILFAAVYGRFEDSKIGGSANMPTANAVPDPTKQVVYYKNDESGRQFFASAGAPPQCESFTHCIYVFDVKDNIVPIKNINGQVSYTVPLSTAVPLTMEQLGTSSSWCKSVPLTVSAPRTTSKTTNNVLIGLGIFFAVVVILYFAMSRNARK